MIRRHALQGSLAIARLEFRCIRRAARTWLLAMVALAAGWGAFVFYHYGALNHYSVGYSGNVVPGRFLMAGYGACFLIALLVGVVLLAFDHRQRDGAVGVLQSLDARPVSNFALLAGRLIALVAAMWVVCALFVVGMQSVGLAADRWFRTGALDSWLGPVEPWTVAAFLFVDAPPALALWVAVVLFLAAVLRSRLAVALSCGALLGGYAWLLLNVPLRLLPGISILSGFDGFASDMLPRLLTVESAVGRCAQLLLATGFVCLGAAWHTRADGSSPARRVVCGLVAAGVGAGAIGAMTQAAFAAEEQRASWRRAQLAQHAPVADLVRLRAEVTIEPAASLRVDAALHLEVPTDPASELVFALNPGMSVERLRLNGQTVAHRHENGLLHVAAAPPLAGTQATLRVVAAGLPDARFAYLDSVIDPLALGVADGHYRTLGTEPMVFSQNYAVLLPGVAWLPTPGAHLHRATPDFHELELRVDVPAGWHAAAPGEREDIEAPAGRRHLRFRTASGVPSYGVVAGRFDRYAGEVGGVELELLAHPGHRRNAEFFAKDAKQLLEMMLGRHFAAAKAAGLAYPHERFSVVEVPGRLRGFGGGWQLDTALALPGIALLREYGLPSVRMTMPPIHMVLFVMAADFSGGDPTIALTRTLMRLRTAAVGEHAMLLNFVMDALMQSALHGGHWPSFFSAHHFSAASAASATSATSATSAAGTRGREVLDMMMGNARAVDAELQRVAERIAISREFLGEHLGELRFEDDPARTLDLLYFKGRKLGQALSHGWRGARGVLREVLRRHAGEAYTLDDLRAAAAAAGAPLDAVVGEWWANAALPGFVASPLEAYRMKDGPNGPRYQLRLHLCNTESVPGLVRLLCRDEANGRCSYLARAVPAQGCVELGEVTAFPPTRAHLDTYLSRNGNAIDLRLPHLDGDRTIDAEPLHGVRPSAWRPAASADIVVDDLSSGFALDDEGAPRGLRLGRRELTWTLQETSGAWGRYARTVTFSSPGDGDRSATFTARLPTAGRWRLHYHLPGSEIAEHESSFLLSRTVRAMRKLGNSEMMLVEHFDANAGSAADTDAERRRRAAGSPGTNDKHTRIDFDGGIAEAGWNHLGDFDLGSAHVSLVVTDRTDGEVVAADAIRWRPLAN